MGLSIIVSPPSGPHYNLFSVRREVREAGVYSAGPRWRMGLSVNRQAREKLAIDGGPPVREEFLVFGSPAIGEEEIEEVVHTLRSGWLGTGPRVKRFEEDFRA